MVACESCIHWVELPTRVDTKKTVGEQITRIGECKKWPEHDCGNGPGKTKPLNWCSDWELK